MSVPEPSKILTPWATSGLKNAIPATANPVTGNAGYDQGFPAINMTPKEAGGIPPFGQDFNGILFTVTEALRYTQAGGAPTFDAALAAAIGGYSKGAVVLGADGVTRWKNQTNGNSTAPETPSSGWVTDGGLLRGIKTFTSSGTYTPADGINFVVVEIQGAGGAGGGTSPTSAAQIAAAYGGLGGAYGKTAKIPVSTSTPIAVTIGAGGTGAAGATGNAGGNTSFGAFAIAPGGAGGALGPAGSGGVLGADVSSSAICTGSAILITYPGGAGGGPITISSSSSSIRSGKGGDSHYGFGGGGTTGATSTPATGKGYGSGGAGQAVGPTAGTALSGAAGAPGVIIIWEYS